MQTPSNSNTVAKPKKFFKSRNSVPDANALALSDSQSMGSPTYMGTPPNVANFYSNQQQHPQYYQQQQPQSVAYPEKTRRKRSTKTGESPKKSKPEKPPKPPKPPKPEKPPKVEKPAKPPKVEKPPKVTKKKGKVEKPSDTPKPTRVLSRTRKVVNYSEDQSRSPPRNAQTRQEPPSTETYANDVVTSSMPGAEIANDNFYNSAEQNQPSYHDEQQLPHPGDSPSKNAGPPIVLRISKVSNHFHSLLFQLSRVSDFSFIAKCQVLIYKMHKSQYQMSFV